MTTCTPRPTCASQPRAPFDNLHLSTTCTSRPRAPLDNVHLSTNVRFSARLLSTLPRLHSLLSLSPLCLVRAFQARLFYERFLHTSAPQHVLSALRPALFSLRTELSHTCASPSSGRAATISTNRERTRHPPPCLSSLRKQADDDAHLLLRFGNRQMMMRICCGGPRARFGGKPRRRHAASPSVPRGV